MLKKIFVYSLIIAATAASCKKPDPLTGFEKTVGSVSLTNVNSSGKIMDFYIDGIKMTQNGALAAGGTILGSYVGINADQHGITIKDATTPTIEYIAGTFTGVVGNAYSYFVYDTLTAGKMKGILLPASRKPAIGETTNANIRFLNFSPKAPELDCWVVRLVGTVRTDSVKIAATRSYIGNIASPDVDALGAYTTIRANQLAGANGTGSPATTYSIKVTLANTNTIVTSASASFVPARNYTLYLRGVFNYPATATYGLGLMTDN